MPKVKATRDEEQGASSSKRRRTEEPPPQQQHHLYLILDDWALGYSIRKIDVSSGALDPLLQLPNGVAREAAAIRLPPPIFRLNARRGLPMFFAAALGSSIVALHPKEEDDRLLLGRGRGIPNCGGAVFDVHKSYLEFIPRPTGSQLMPVYFSIGNKLLALAPHSLQLLDLSPMDEDPGLECELGSLSWRELPDAPFHSAEVVSYAVLPGERATTIFASVGLFTDDATYSFQVMADDGSTCWKLVGEWVLPFHGRGYFDPALNAWVGLSKYCLETGHVCACQLVSPTSSDCPGWKFSKEKLFSDDPAETHVGATLVYMGGRSRFCLLECVVVYYKQYRRAKPYHFEDKDADQQPFRYFYRVTTFSLGES
ncbi:unnamed protein product [Urochloa decumbens]|uniref:Uncharacterized protein n=1 Tax=Urochloa decumbens TaxID=240449 RepID=A0ABC8X238_9POAL